MRVTRGTTPVQSMSATVPGTAPTMTPLVKVPQRTVVRSGYTYIISCPDISPFSSGTPCSQPPPSRDTQTGPEEEEVSQPPM